MDSKNRQKKAQELEELRKRVQQLESELQSAPEHWQATEYYATYHATTGFFL
jgi:predicted  nucleic acid-binding Zn-ribbon protein